MLNFTELPVDAAYVSTALSNDAAMGEDSAIECVSINGQVHVFASFIKRDPPGTHRENIVSLIIKYLFH